MAKNKHRQVQQAVASGDRSPGRPAAQQVNDPGGISVKGWKVIAAGIGTVVIGFIVLCFTDPAGQNWASTLSPFLILGGYGTIAAGILQK